MLTPDHAQVLISRIEKNENKRSFGITGMSLGLEISQLEFSLFTQKYYLTPTWETKSKAFFLENLTDSLGNKTVHTKIEQQ